METVHGILFFVLRIIFFPVILFLRYVLKWNRLAKIPTVSLGGDIKEAIGAYSEPIGTEESDIYENAKVYTFDVKLFHYAHITAEADGRIVGIAYISVHPDPANDLMFMMERYGEGLKWHETEKGFLYIREDRTVVLHCSAAPIIGVRYIPVGKEDEGVTLDTMGPSGRRPPTRHGE